jgi:hypothetical protein
MPRVSACLRLVGLMFAAIRKLAKDSDFQDRARGRGIPWKGVQIKLAEFLPETLGHTIEQREDWLRNQNLVKRALDDILGPENVGWRTEKRESKSGPPRPVSWIIATEQAKPVAASVPDLPEDWPPDDQFEPPTDGLF